jgi:hypothetical protein
MSIPAIVRQRSPRRLALILSAALALALLGGVPAQAQAAGGTLQVWAIGQEPDGDWVSLGPGVLVGEEVRPAGFTIPVGAEAHLTLLDSTLPAARPSATGGRVSGPTSGATTATPPGPPTRSRRSSCSPRPSWPPGGSTMFPATSTTT